MKKAGKKQLSLLEKIMFRIKIVTLPVSEKAEYIRRLKVSRFKNEEDLKQIIMSHNLTLALEGLLSSKTLAKIIDMLLFLYLRYALNHHEIE